jgi:hypothetical protein
VPEPTVVPTPEPVPEPWAAGWQPRPFGQSAVVVQTCATLVPGRATSIQAAMESPRKRALGGVMGLLGKKGWVEMLARRG